MYEFPFGAGQQLNLNWIINEIITLHKQLDPDYELPNFDTTFPYMNLNTLNLDWILRELKAIKDLAPTEDATLLKMVANALIAETYDTTTQYNVDDIVYRDNEKRLFKCVTATPAGGEPFDSNKWVEVDVGEVLTDLLVNGGTANAVTNVRYNDHKIQQEINGTYSDVIVIEDTPTDVSDRLPSSKAVYNLNGAINNLSRIYGKQIAIYGDSWATETYGALGATYLSQMSGKTVHISASGSKTMKNVLDDFWDNYNADIYIIQAGLNDKVQNVGATQFIKAIKDFVTAIRTVNTNAEIYFITPQMTHVANQYQNCFPNEFYRTIIWRLSGIYGFSVINSLKWTDVKLLSDNVHPTSASYPLIANHIANAIQNYGDEETHDTEFSNLGRANNQLLFYCEGGIFFFLTQNVSVAAMSTNYAQLGFSIGTVFMSAETVTTNRTNGSFTRMYYNAAQPNYIQFSVASLPSGDTFTNNGTKLIVSIVDLQIPINAW